jgi:hypothetical protein
VLHGCLAAVIETPVLSDNFLPCSAEGAAHSKCVCLHNIVD